MHLEILSRLLLLVLSWRKTLCFASSSLPAIPRVPIENDDGNNSKKFEHQPTTPIRIASLNKYGGNIKFFDVDAGENAITDTNNTVTRFSRIKNPCIFVAALRKKIKQASRTTFLPLGYPEKTQAKYFEYCVWSWIQDASTQLRSVLATQKILEGVGVGKEGATALSALFNFLVRDGCGMFASKSSLTSTFIRMMFLSFVEIIINYFFFFQTCHSPTQHHPDFAQMLKDGEYLLTLALILGLHLKWQQRYFRNHSFCRAFVLVICSKHSVVLQLVQVEDQLTCIGQKGPIFLILMQSLVLSIL